MIDLPRAEAREVMARCRSAASGRSESPAIATDAWELRRVRLHFYRDEKCGDRVIFGDFGIWRMPAFKTTSIHFSPDNARDFTFTCAADAGNTEGDKSMATFMT